MFWKKYYYDHPISIWFISILNEGKKYFFFSINQSTHQVLVNWTSICLYLVKIPWQFMKATTSSLIPSGLSLARLVVGLNILPEWGHQDELNNSQAWSYTAFRKTANIIFHFLFKTSRPQYGIELSFIDIHDWMISLIGYVGESTPFPLCGRVTDIFFWWALLLGLNHKKLYDV